MLIGELCRVAQTTRDTIRYYEREGLLVADRRRNRYKEYGPDALRKLRFIKEMQTLGFSLREIREQLGMAQEGGPICDEMARLLVVVTANLESRIKALQEQKSCLEAFFEECTFAESSELCRPVSRALARDE